MKYLNFIYYVKIRAYWVSERPLFSAIKDYVFIIFFDAQSHWKMWRMIIVRFNELLTLKSKGIFDFVVPKAEWPCSAWLQRKLFIKEPDKDQLHYSGECIPPLNNAFYYRRKHVISILNCQNCLCPSTWVGARIYDVTP